MTLQVAKVILASALCLPTNFLTRQSHQQTGRVEFRLAETKYAEGLTEAVVGSAGSKVYLHKEPAVSDNDILQAHLVLGNNTGDFGVLIAFTDVGAKRMADATRGHLNKPLALVLDGKVLAARPANTVNNGYFRFTGLSRAEADKIAKAINLSSVLALIKLPGGVKFEIRLAQRVAGKGLTATIEKNTLQRIYLFKDILISNKDIAGARVVSGYREGVFDIALALTRNAIERIARAGETNRDKMLAVLINGRVVSAPFIIGKVSSVQMFGNFPISADFTKEEAESIANAINGR